jgi:hypothetical protein
MFTRRLNTEDGRCDSIEVPLSRKQGTSSQTQGLTFTGTEEIELRPIFSSISNATPQGGTLTRSPNTLSRDATIQHSRIKPDENGRKDVVYFGQFAKLDFRDPPLPVPSIDAPKRLHSPRQKLSYLLGGTCY